MQVAPCALLPAVHAYAWICIVARLKNRIITSDSTLTFRRMTLMPCTYAVPARCVAIASCASDRRPRRKRPRDGNKRGEAKSRLRGRERERRLWRGQPPPIKDEMMENNECSMDNSFIKQFRIESFDSFRSGSRKVFLKCVHFEEGFLI